VYFYKFSFADDIDSLADTEENLQKLTAVHTASEQYGLKINATKTKMMKIGKKETPDTGIMYEN